MTLYLAVELFASVAENLLIFGVIAEISGKKYTGIKHFLLLALCTGVSAILVTYLNFLAAFSFITILVMFISDVMISKAFSTGGWLIRATACILALFFLHTLDYVVGFTVGLAVEPSTNVFHNFDILMKEGPVRIIYTAVNKGLQILAFFLLLPVYKKIRLLNRRHMIELILITSACYIIMSILTGFIMTESIAIMQIAIIFSWIFIMLCVIAVIITLSINSRYRQKLREDEMIALTNEMMEKNYKNLNLKQHENAKLVHDFANHLIALKGLSNNPIETDEYIDGLLETSKEQAKLCKSKNDVVNSIVNCKIAEANLLQVFFKFTVDIPNNLTVSSIDICAVLANQLDNALEACSKIPEEKHRFIEAKLWHQGNFLFFKIVNSTQDNPFNSDNELITTKESGLHGFGLKSIQEAVDKYDGTLENFFHGNQFTSIAMMQMTD